MHPKTINGYLCQFSEPKKVAEQRGSISINNTMDMIYIVENLHAPQDASRLPNRVWLIENEGIHRLYCVI
jgi:hypothetical protein